MSSVLVRKEAQLGLKLVAPAVGIIALLVVYPIGFNIYLSFFDVQLNGDKHFVGLTNYSDLLSNPRYYHSVGVSVIYLLGTVAGTTLLGLAAAVLMNQTFHFRNLARVYFRPSEWHL